MGLRIYCVDCKKMIQKVIMIMMRKRIEIIKNEKENKYGNK